MAKKHDLVLENVLENITPSEEKFEFIDEKLNLFLEKINKRIRKSGLDLEIFIGGSFAKKTLIKKKVYQQEDAHNTLSPHNPVNTAHIYDTIPEHHPS